MSHRMNDKVFDFINDRWFEMNVDDFKDWLKTHRQRDDVADRVYLALDYLEEKWKQEKLDRYPYV
jgi:erythromycin esterase-like protein